MILKKILEAIFVMDLFQVNLLFFFKGKTKQSSSFGLILSFLIFAFLTYQLAVSELFAKVSPSIIMQSLGSSHAERIDFNEKNYILLGIGNETHRFIEPTIFDIMVFHFVNDQPTLNTVHPCKYEDLKEAMDEEYFTKIATNLYCLQNKVFSLEGFVDEIGSDWKFSQFYVNPCNNITMNNTCKSPEEIASFLKGKFFTITYPSIQIDGKNYKNPLKINLDPVTMNLDAKVFKTNIVYLKKAEVLTDDGWLFDGTDVRKDIGLNSD